MAICTIAHNGQVLHNVVHSTTPQRARGTHGRPFGGLGCSVEHSDRHIVRGTVRKLGCSVRQSAYDQVALFCGAPEPLHQIHSQTTRHWHHRVGWVCRGRKTQPGSVTQQGGTKLGLCARARARRQSV